VPFVVNASNQDSHPFLYWGAILLLLVIAPIAWPFALRQLFRWRWLAQHVQLPFPTAWDFFFHRRRPAFLLFRLKDGSFLAGYWGPNSYAGSFPNDGDVYIEAVYSLNEDGTFGEPIADTAGALIRRDQYESIEIFTVPDEQENIEELEAGDDDE